MIKKKKTGVGNGAAGQIHEAVKKHKKFKNWQKIVCVLAVPTLLLSGFSMSRPAATMNQETFCNIEEHVHAEDCYEMVLTCGLEEAHVHTDACYEDRTVLTCTIPESDSAILSTAAEKMEKDEESVEPCPTDEESSTSHYADEEESVQEEHSHTDACYEHRQELVCGLSENQSEHIHTEECFEKKLICGKKEHTHDLSCYSNPYADLETPERWQSSVSGVKLTGVRADDLVAVAESQLGYKESSENYIPTEDGVLHGYTRYGAWYGFPYSDWCAMFVSFCLNYAEITPEVFPYDLVCADWVEKLTELGMYVPAAEAVPEKGAVVFFDNGRDDGLAGHVGIVAEVITDDSGAVTEIKTIEGNNGDYVAEFSYPADSEKILGYGFIPPARENESSAEGAEPFERVFTAEYEDLLSVEAVISNGAELPEDLSLVLIPITEEDYGYEELTRAVLAELNRELNADEKAAEPAEQTSEPENQAVPEEQTAEPENPEPDEPMVRKLKDYPAEALSVYAIEWLSDGRAYELSETEKSSLTVYISGDDAEGAEIFAVAGADNADQAAEYSVLKAQTEEKGLSIDAAELFAVAPMISPEAQPFGYIDDVQVEDSPSFKAWRDRFVPEHPEHDNFVITLKNESDSTTQLAYCYNFEKKYPTQWYRTWGWKYYPTYYCAKDANEATFLSLASDPKDGGERLRERVMSVAWNGYPYDAAGLSQKFASEIESAIKEGIGGRPDNILYLATQRAVWYFTDHNTMTEDIGFGSYWNVNIPAQVKAIADELVRLADDPDAQAPKNFALDLYLTSDKSTAEADNYVDKNGTMDFQRLLALRGQPAAYLQLKLNKTWRETDSVELGMKEDKSHPPITFQIYKGEDSQRTLVDTVEFAPGETEKVINLVDERTKYTIVEVTTGCEVLDIETPDIGDAGASYAPQEYTIDLSKIDRETGKLVTKRELEYINEAPGSVDITKEVTNATDADETVDFRFTVSIADKNGKPYTGLLQYTNGVGHVSQPKHSDGTFEISLRNKEHGMIEWLPKGAKVTFTERPLNGWKAVEPVTTEIHSGTRVFAKVTNIRETPEAVFELPETGGGGVYGYIGGGMALVFVSVLSLYIIKHVNRKEEGR